MHKFPDIEAFRHLIQSMNKHCEFKGLTVKPIVNFTGTVKLHGTSGGMRVTANRVVPQGRNQTLAIGQDNCGFAHFMASYEDTMRVIANAFFPNSNDVTVYGEWCGQGIQKNVAVSTLPKHFVIFGIYDDETETWATFDELNHYVKHADPDFLKELNFNNIFFIHQAETFRITVDFNNPQVAADILTELTLQVEKQCPWGTFRGATENSIGEGIVWISEGYPIVLTFKSKGLEHKNAGKGGKVEVDSEKMANIGAVVDLILPDWRLEQGVTELKNGNNGHLDVRQTGLYIKWIHQDILKEESDQIAANDFPWKELVGVISNRAKTYFMQALDENAGLAG